TLRPSSYRTRIELSSAASTTPCVRTKHRPVTPGPHVRPDSIPCEPVTKPKRAEEMDAAPTSTRPMPTIHATMVRALRPALVELAVRLRERIGRDPDLAAQIAHLLRDAPLRGGLLLDAHPDGLCVDHAERRDDVLHLRVEAR